MRHLFVFLFVCVLLGLAPPPVQAAQGGDYFKKRPKLVVLLVIDQFRADYLTRFQQKFGQGGFNRLMSAGAYVPWAQYGIMHSMTGPGHATLVTGAYPYQMGIPLNTWYDDEKKKSVYCVESATPEYLTGSTFGDELKSANKTSKVVTVSLKDRAAILTGGHLADLALWFDEKSFKWTSSPFYLKGKPLPAFVDRVNATIGEGLGRVLSWAPERGPSMAGEGFLPNPEAQKVGLAFPHLAPIGKKAALYLPYGLDLTEQMAEEAIKGFKLGRDATPDFLVVSFSTHDYLGHAFGPYSPEMEQITLAEDQVLARFLKFIDHGLPGGMKDVVLALSADHGIPPNPDLLVGTGADAGRIEESEVSARIERRLTAKFGKPARAWLPFVIDLNFWVSREAVKSRNADLKEVLEEASDEIRKTHGIAQVFNLSDYREGRLPPGMFRTLAERTYIPGRSGDIVAIPKPFYFPADAEAVTHMTGYSYDRTVPLILVGPKIRKGVYSEQIFTIDLAPTLSFLSGVLPPSGSEGRVLSELIE